MTKEEQMKVINHGIHDLVGATCTIGTWISYLKILAEKDTLTNENLVEVLDKMKERLKRIDEVGDFIYVKFKEQ